MSDSAILPDGRRVVLSALADYSLSGFTITFTRTGGTTFTYVDPNGNANNAAYVLSQVDNAFSDSSTTIQIKSSPFRIDSITPSPFNITSSTITIKGSGFQNSTGGLLYIEDVGGGLDLNGYSMTCTVVDDNTMTAVFNSAGDGVLGGAGVLIVYKDGSGKLSNTLNGTNTSGTNITVP